MATTSVKYESLYPKNNIRFPHVATAYNEQALNASNSASVKAIGFLGSSTDGIPNQVYKCSSLPEAQQAFGSGPLVDAMELAWKPDSAGGDIYAMRVEDAQQATLTDGGLEFVSKMYGEGANKISVALEQETLTNSYRVTVKYAPKQYQEQYTGLGQMFQIGYNANDPANAVATYSVVKAADGTASKFVIDVTDAKQPIQPTTTTSTTTSTTLNPTTTTTSTTSTTNMALEDNNKITLHQEFDLTSTTYNTIFGLMTGLDLIPNVEVTMDNLNDNSEIPSTALDEATDIDFNHQISDINHLTYVWAIAADIADKVQYDTYVDVHSDLSKPLPKPFGDTYLLGGETEPAPVSWANKLKPFMNVPVYYMVPLTGLAAVHSEVRSFVDDSYIQGHSMRAFVGGEFNETPTKSIARQLALKDGRMAVLNTSGYMTMSDGRNLHLPAYMGAAYTAGIASGLQVGGSLTNKETQYNSIDQNYTTETLNQLNSNGVLVIRPVMNNGTSDGFRYVQDVTTDNSTNEVSNSRISMGEITDFLFDKLRVDLSDNYLGVNVRTTSSEVIKEHVASFLMQEKLSPSGLITDFDEDSIQVLIDGDLCYIMFTVAPSQTLDYIYVYGAYSKYQSSTASSNTSYIIDANGNRITTTVSDTGVNNEAYSTGEYSDNTNLYDNPGATAGLNS
mgnify:CR=1 FL=1